MSKFVKIEGQITYCDEDEREIKIDFLKYGRDVKIDSENLYFRSRLKTTRFSRRIWKN